MSRTYLLYRVSIIGLIALFASLFIVLFILSYITGNIKLDNACSTGYINNLVTKIALFVKIICILN